MSRKIFRVAIVGAGPAGFYAASQLLKQHEVDVRVDLIDRLPTPFGLVRSGVAPDHPEKKLVIDNLFGYCLDHPAVRFFGNIDLGTDVTHEELKTRYEAVIYSVGANSDAKLGIPGEALKGSHAAREFVGWYNGHPDFRDCSFDLSGKRAVIIGNGNVALDIARILTHSAAELKRTDIADHAIEALAKSAIQEVLILGRRGHVHAAFNNPEVEELEHLENVDVSIENVDFDEAHDELDWSVRRKVSTLKRLAKMPKRGHGKSIVLRFLTTPVEICGTGSVSHLKTVSSPTRVLAAQTSESEQGSIESLIETGLILRSVGYRGASLPGLPFDEEKGVIPNENGRVLAGADVMPGTYVCGWIKRGARGVIGTNKKCAQETVSCLLEDIATGGLGRSEPVGGDIENLLRERKPGFVEASHWNRIDKSERIKGLECGRPRVKITSWKQLLDVSNT